MCYMWRKTEQKNGVHFNFDKGELIKQQVQAIPVLKSPCR